MDAILKKIEEINSAVNGVVWGIPMLILIICTGIYMTVRTGFFQIIRAKFVSRETVFAIFTKRGVTKTKEKKAISQFQALSTALAATIGTGNIAGVATAIAIGGPGAVFWMWISAFFGMMTNYSENVLGIFYRKKNDKGEWSGGAMYYLQEGLKERRGVKHIAKPLAIAFAVFCILASFGIGNMTQINSISGAMKTNFSIPPLVSGIALSIIAGLVIIGGIKRIGKVTEKIVPFMALAYIVGSVAILILNFKQIPYVFGSIFSSAFSFAAIGGGVAGGVIKKAVTMGFKRGVFSNEAGLGSSVMVHSASDVKEPVIQGMWGIFEVFFDTIIVCTLTAFTLLSSNADAVTLDHALANVSTSTQYFEIYDMDNYEEGMVLHLIDKHATPIVIQSNSTTDESKIGDVYTATANGKTFEVSSLAASELSEDDYIYTNIMALTGIAEKDNAGNVIKDENGDPVISSVKFEMVEGVSLVTYAFSQRFGSIAGKFLSIAILLFAFSTVLGWSFYGTKSIEYLFGSRATAIYKVIFVVFIVVGATMNLSLAWDIADTLNALMAIPNLIGVLILSNVVIKITRNYVGRKITKKDESAEPMLSAYDDIQAEQAAKLDEE